MSRPLRVQTSCSVTSLQSFSMLCSRADRFAGGTSNVVEVEETVDVQARVEAPVSLMGLEMPALDLFPAVVAEPFTPAAVRLSGTVSIHPDPPIPPVPTPKAEAKAAAGNDVSRAVDMILTLSKCNIRQLKTSYYGHPRCCQSCPCYVQA